MVIPSIKSLEEVIEDAQKTINNYLLTVKGKDESIEGLKERIEIQERTIALLNETVKAKDELIDAERQETYNFHNQLLSLSIGQRLFSLKKRINNNINDVRERRKRGK